MPPLDTHTETITDTDMDKDTDIDTDIDTYMDIDTGHRQFTVAPVRWCNRVSST